MKAHKQAAWARPALETSVGSKPGVDGRITLHAVDSDGVNLELDMPSWAIEAIWAGGVVAYQPNDATDWTEVVENDGTFTLRLPLDRSEWSQLDHD